MSVTTDARVWILRRADGVTQGFTDHDAPLEVDGVTCTAATGLTARALSQTSGLAVDNSEAMGVLSDDAISDADLEAGRYDGAVLETWLVNWRDPAQRVLRFSGTLGDVRRGAGEFHAELRGLTEALNQSRGQVYLGTCSAVLGDGRCKFIVDDPSFSTTVTVASVESDHSFTFSNLSAFAPNWFERGQIKIQTGAATGLTGIIKHDRPLGAERHLTLWAPIAAEIAAGDSVQLLPGCDKRAETCRAKFNNFSNFRGFPHIPGDDWLVATPARQS